MTKKDNARFYPTAKNYSIDAGKGSFRSGGIETLPDGEHPFRRHSTARDAGSEWDDGDITVYHDAAGIPLCLFADPVIVHS